MTETVTTPTKVNKSALIRELLKDKSKTRAQIAEEVGCSKQYVFSVQNKEKVKARKARAKRKLERQAELRNGAPKRKYTKSGKFAKQVPAPTTPMVEPVVKTQYIEVEVPQPFSHYTFWQRLRILFLGGAA
jgi:transcriptional regulator with XRE-family HTH domain